MHLDSQKTNDALIVRLRSTRLDAAAAIGFKDEMRELTTKAYNTAAIRQILLDLSEVNFIDSSGLGALVAVFKSVEKKHPMQIVSPQKNVMDVFRLTHLDRIFTIHDTMPLSRS